MSPIDNAQSILSEKANNEGLYYKDKKCVCLEPLLSPTSQTREPLAHIREEAKFNNNN
ncbi:MAG: hypothetical protein NW207_03835 [Cytophagales bacterium]|nr:hypothetical protein [Cytophagales bacterium]